MEIQSIIGADIWMAFDWFPGYPAERAEAEKSVQRTTAWAKRCKEWDTAYRATPGARQHMLFGIVQGSTNSADKAALNSPALDLMDMPLEDWLLVSQKKKCITR
jgi:tRNA-guanine family transglycosylase